MSALGAALSSFGMPDIPADVGAVVSPAPATTATTTGTPCGPNRNPNRNPNRSLNRRGVAARLHSQSGARNDPEQAGLIALVKDEQKKSADVRARWRDYCDVMGSGTRDPSLHGAAFLRAFFELSSVGQVPEPLHNRSMPGPELCPEEAHAVLAAKVRHGLQTPAFKKAWAAFCGTSPPGMQDPLRHDNDGLRQFLLHLAPKGKEQACKDPYAAPAQHASLLSECVRVMQSKKLGWKNQWDNFSDTRGGGVRDPARHSEGILWEFILAAKPPCPPKMLPQKYRAFLKGAASSQKQLESASKGMLTVPHEPMKALEIGLASDCSTEDNGADTGSSCSFPAYIVGCDDGHNYDQYPSEGFYVQTLWSC